MPHKDGLLAFMYVFSQASFCEHTHLHLLCAQENFPRMVDLFLWFRRISPQRPAVSTALYGQVSYQIYSDLQNSTWHPTRKLRNLSVCLSVPAERFLIMNP